MSTDEYKLVETPYSYPEQEKYPNKNFVLKNNTNHIITMAQLQSDWENVNFIIESEDTPKRKRTKRKEMWRELATLYPGDLITLTFHEPHKIEK